MSDIHEDRNTFDKFGLATIEGMQGFFVGGCLGSVIGLILVIAFLLEVLSVIRDINLPIAHVLVEVSDENASSDPIFLILGMTLYGFLVGGLAGFVLRFMHEGKLLGRNVLIAVFVLACLAFSIGSFYFSSQYFVSNSIDFVLLCLLPFGFTTLALTVFVARLYIRSRKPRVERC